jgi:hypothetical protein
MPATRNYGYAVFKVGSHILFSSLILSVLPHPFGRVILAVMTGILLSLPTELLFEILSHIRVVNEKLYATDEDADDKWGRSKRRVGRSQ